MPKAIDFSSYAVALEKLLPNLWNSFSMVIPATIISLLIGSMNGYALSK
ncbi:hypothetical protein [Bacillus salipaludis]|uniref:Uncharacterized protein n=1 Tax=Bacillus salipaludis TaxID=2547811 RepID=A0ABW8RLZ2_9BACI